MQRKSLGREVPELPLDVRERLEGVYRPSWAGPEERIWLGPKNRNNNPYAEPEFGSDGVALWRPDPEDIPAVFFAARRSIDGATWLIRGELIPDLASGLLKLRRLTVEPWEHDGEVTGAILRKVKVADLRDRAFQTMRFYASRPTYSYSSCGPDDYEVDPDDFDPDTQAYSDYLASERAPRRLGRPGHGDDHYRRVALEYLALYEKGAKPLLPELGRRLGVPWQTARDQVHRARELGYLLPGEPGRKGGSPGPRLTSDELAATATGPSAPRTAPATNLDEADHQGFSPSAVG